MQVLQAQVSPLKAKISNKTKTKKDDKIENIMADNWWEGDDDYSWLDDTVGDYSDDDYSIESYLDDSWDTDLWGGSDQYDDFGLADLFDNYNFDDTFSADDFDMDSDWWNDTDWWEDSFDDEGNYNYDPIADLYGNTDLSPEGQISSWMENWLESGASTEGLDYTDSLPGGDYYVEPEGGNKFLEFLNMVTGNIGQNPNRSGNKLGGIGQYLGDFLSSPLAALLLMNQKNKDAREQINIPIGQEAYGSGAGVGSLPDYRISNIQPALLPGMAYANQPTTFNADPPGMQAGGLASHNHPQLHSHGNRNHPDDAVPGMPGVRRRPFRPKARWEALMNNGMQSGGIASLENMMDGPGDITQAMLEPGEFVMTRKATENLTPEYLYKLMHQAENAGRMR